MRNVFMLAFFMLSCIAWGQTNTAQGDTVFNQTDKQGLKQGFWKGYYQNGKIKYIGFFKDNKPVGTLKRYFEDGTLKAIMIYDPTGTKARTKLYYQGSTIAAEGNYVNSIKDSIWNYYSFYEKTLSNKENYVHGKKNGFSISYYSTGKKAEEVEYKNDIKDGKWRQYYEDGTDKLIAGFIQGKREGDFLFFYPNKSLEWKGFYKNDKKSGVWQHFTPDAKPEAQIEFVDGIAKNAEELDKKEQQLLKEIEQKKGKIPEPDENNIIPGSGM